jgi:hypothetical protein
MCIKRFGIVFFVTLAAGFAEPIPAHSDDVVISDQAKGFVSQLEDTLTKLFPRLGQDILGVKVYVEREVKIDYVGFDADSGVVTAKAHVKYYTPDSAAINMAGLGISVSTDFDTQYNVQTGDLTKLKVSFDLPKGWGSVDVNLGAIKAVMDGDIGAVLDLIPNGGLVKRDTSSEYDARKKWFQDKYGGANVYFASSDFVRWAGLETAGNWVVGLIATGGSYAGQIANEALNEARKELTHITAWLQTRAGMAAAAAAQDLLNGKPIALPQLKLVWQKVMYHSHVVIAGRSLPDQPVPHAAFVLLWLDGASPATSFDPGTQPLAADNDPRPKWKLGARCAIGATGCRITFIDPGGATDKAGLKIDDVITKADGKPVGSPDNQTNLLVRQVKASPDQTMTLDVLSDSQTKTVQVTLDPVF